MEYGTPSKTRPDSQHNMGGHYFVKIVEDLCI